LNCPPAETMLLIMAWFASGPDGGSWSEPLSEELKDLLPGVGIGDDAVLNRGGTPFGYWALTASCRPEFA